MKEHLSNAAYGVLDYAAYPIGMLLVAPVVTEDNHKNIYFPPGKWSSLWTGQTVSGPTNFTTDVPLNTIPVYLKPGAAGGPFELTVNVGRAPL